MNQKKSIFISCLGGGLLLAVVILISCLGTKGEETVRTAENCTQLKLYVNFPSGIEKINIWQKEDGNFYFFLPAGAENCELTFGNLSDDSFVELEGAVFGARDDISIFLDALPLGGTLELTMRTDGKEPETVNVRFMRSENIATMFINTASGTMDSIHADKNVKETASLHLLDGAGNRCYAGTLEYIKTRGNSSWGLEKKPYQIKLAKEAKLLNMPSAKRWILIPNMVDDTLIKNELVYRYAERYTTVPSIQGQYVDLYVNGEYRGNYYLCEKIEVSKTRLDITDLEAATEAVNYDGMYEAASLYVSEDGNIKAVQGLDNPKDITGGYLLEHISDIEYERVENAFRTGSGECYSIVSPSPATVEQAEYICGLFNEMEAAMTQENGINPVTGKHFSEYLDIESWASKYVMEETFNDPDADETSMYFYKDSDSVDPLIYSGPMWDYDRALGCWGNGISIYNADNARRVGSWGIYVQKLMKFKEVSDLVYGKFEAEMVPYVEYIALADIYKLNQWIEASAEMDEIRWNANFGYYQTRSDNLDYTIWFLKTKAGYLREYWLGGEEYCTVTFLDYDGQIYKSYRIKKGECLGEVPNASCHVAVFAGWYVQGGICLIWQNCRLCQM